ncbi:MAG TPA: stalk domain-containing protein [Symbiobacteriaceae bacterium]
MTIGICLAAATAVAAGQTYQGFAVVNVVVNGKPLQSDVPAVIFYGRTVLPLRAVADAAGMDVAWDTAANTATLTSKVVKTDNTAGQQLADLKTQVDQLQSDNSGLRAQLAQAASGLTAAEATRLKAMTEGDFETYLQQNFGTLGGNKLDYGSLEGYNNYYFTCRNDETCRSISVHDRLNWLDRFATALTARHANAQYSGSLYFDYSYPTLTSVPDRYIGDAHLQSDRKWRVHHFVMGVSRVDLQQFGGLQPATVSMGDD